jgi:hypothetical protein
VISSRRGSSLPAVSACREEITAGATSSPKRCRVRAEPGMRGGPEAVGWHDPRGDSGLRLTSTSGTVVGGCDLGTQSVECSEGGRVLIVTVGTRSLS